MEKHPLHLKNPDLQTSPEINRAVERKEDREGVKVPNDPSERIEAYMDRLENIFLNPDERKRERNLEMFRDKIYDALVIKRDNFPDSYFELQKRIARERGQAVEEIPENVQEQMKDVAIEDQRHSLDAWIDYLTSNDAVYPPWFKYFVWRNITKLSQFDKERGEFKKRTDTTIAPFPDIYREPLAQIADIYEKVKADNKNLKELEVRDAFSKKFPALYTELIQKSLAVSMESREEIKGTWIRYKQGKRGDAEKLYQSLEGKGTGWCTAGHSTAQTQIESGDFYVYYTNDANGEPTQPRLAIRMDGGNRIGEVRGILPHQGVEPLMQKVLDDKLQEFGKEADVYRKKSADMRILTALEKKHESGQSFTKDDLAFLYEVNSKIEGFGYQEDPRIAELRRERNAGEDMLAIFECTKAEIAHVPSEITEKTKAYVGQLEPGIFNALPSDFQHIYTTFPEGQIKQRKIELGTDIKDGPAFTKEIKAKGMRIGDAESMLTSPDFKVVGTRETADLVELSVSALGFTTTTRYDALCKRALELGLELCPPEVGPQLRLQYTDQPNDVYLTVAMKAITGSGGSPDVFNVGRLGYGLWLSAFGGHPDNEWNPEDRFVFLRPRNSH